MVKVPKLHLLAATGLLTALVVPSAAAGASSSPAVITPGVQHIVVIYEENHSFDNLYGMWPGVNGISSPGARARSTQVSSDAARTPLRCLPQDDVNLTSPTPLSGGCTFADPGSGVTTTSHFLNQPFNITDYIPATATTCPVPGTFYPNGVLNGTGQPGGCTRDLVHRYYQEQYQIDGGRMDRYTVGSDAVGLTQGYYDTTTLPVYQYLTSPTGPRFAVEDRFFQGAFGGSFLNHQYLVAAQAPIWTGADATGGANDLHSVVGTDGHPNSYLLHPATGVKDGALTEAANASGVCAPPPGSPTPPAGTKCGDYAINTIQPTYWPYAPGTPVARQLPPLTSPNIGDSLSAKGVSWAWYAGGWDNATGNTTGAGWTNGSGATCSDPNANTTTAFPLCPDKLFQYHHQPFNYFATYAPGTAARAAHLRDEQDFLTDVAGGTMKAVSFIKPVGEENEHPGYTGLSGDNHLVNLIKAIEAGPQAASTMIVVTYDEFGGQWDHVTPPSGKEGVSDAFGPGTRVPALVISDLLPRGGAIDHVSHDTTSILATIEHTFNVAPVATRDAAVKDLYSAFCPVVTKTCG